MTTHKPSADIELLNVLRNKDRYEQYIKFIKEHAVTEYTAVLLKDLPHYFSAYPTVTEVDWDQFRTWFKVVRHPTWKSDKLELYSLVFDNLIRALALPVNPTVLDHFIRMDYATRIANECRAVETGDTKAMERIAELINDANNAASHKFVKAYSDEMFAGTDIQRLLDEQYRSGGLEWRLEDMNVSLGPLHKGDLVMVAARPEVGKTSFLCSEFVHMASQLPEDAELVIFNNEERNKLMLRLLMAATGLTLFQIAALPEADVIAQYSAAVKGPLTKIRIVEPEGGISVRDIEQVLLRKPYAICGINVMDKVNGFTSVDGDVNRQRELAKWARGLASKYAPIIAIYQADASAEGVKWLNQSQIYGTKTGVQGEADALIMIGCDPMVDDRRYISVAKNKLPGGKRTLPKHRHGKFEVAFNPGVGVYSTIEFK